MSKPRTLTTTTGGWDIVASSTTAAAPHPSTTYIHRNELLLSTPSTRSGHDNPVTPGEGEVIRVNLNGRNFWFGIAAGLVSLGVGVLGAAQWLYEADYTANLGWFLAIVGAAACLVGLFVNLSEGNGPVVMVVGVVALSFGVAIANIGGVTEWLVERNFDTLLGWSLVVLGAVVVGGINLLLNEQSQSYTAPSH